MNCEQDKEVKSAFQNAWLSLREPTENQKKTLNNKNDDNWFLINKLKKSS